MSKKVIEALLDLYTVCQQCNKRGFMVMYYHKNHADRVLVNVYLGTWSNRDPELDLSVYLDCSEKLILKSIKEAENDLIKFYMEHNEEVYIR